MAKPAVFVSSTFVDLKDIRHRLADFISEMGYEPRLFEKGGVGFDHQKPFDESCYEAVSECDIFVLIIGGRYGSPASDSKIKNGLKKYNSVTRKEYLQARRGGVPIYIFVEKNVHAEYKTYSKNKDQKMAYAHVDNPLVFDLIEDIYKQRLNNYINEFVDVSDITSVLKSQWATMVRAHIRERLKVKRRNTVRINSFKLFYHRVHEKKTISDLAADAGVSRSTILRLERLKSRNAKFDGYHVRYFPECEASLLVSLESSLSCAGRLRAGQHDDFLSTYVEHYAENRRDAKDKSGAQLPILAFETKVVIFDFDGTITIDNNGRTTWELIWENLGYSINECAEYHSMFRKGKISHKEWCDITAKKFLARNFTYKTLSDVANSVILTPGLRETLAELSQRNIKLYILSGSIRELIRLTLGPEASHFEEIRANEMRFDDHGMLLEIVGTQFDFEGKAAFIRRVVTEQRCSPMDVLFIGNAGNDVWASDSGARTLCVNPTSTDPDNPRHWNANIRLMHDLREVLAYVS